MTRHIKTEDGYAIGGGEVVSRSKGDPGLTFAGRGMRGWVARMMEQGKLQEG